ncbi:CRISPR-associated protein Cas5 [Kribbella jiaozuonensis]|uniref:CRISPR-associated protein Cas5 n=1 Tax=Kribbella jiaozuonensis TaxID=2575441 RepID=A0A4U3LWC2_9ACTN|nr:CRISPR-associated protein Cas5 [Kribbella jiaozuonensis]
MWSTSKDGRQPGSSRGLRKVRISQPCASWTRPLSFAFQMTARWSSW